MFRWAAMVMLCASACTFDRSGLVSQIDADPGAPDGPSTVIDARPGMIDAGPLPPPDAMPMCVDDSCDSCGAFSTCTACCLNGCGGNSCTNGCSCTFECSNASRDCAPTCSGSTCTIDCSNFATDKCKPTCNQLASCTNIDCRGTSSCEPACDGALCIVDCTDAQACDKVDCTSGSTCTVKCGGTLADVKCAIRVCKNLGGTDVTPRTCCDILDSSVAYRLCNHSLCPLGTSEAACL